MYCGTGIDSRFCGFTIVFEPNVSVIEVGGDYGKETIVHSKKTKKRFRKVLRKIAKGVCPVCKKEMDIGWVDMDYKEHAKFGNVYLFHSGVDSDNTCFAEVSVSKVWAWYAKDKKDIGIHNRCGNRKIFASLTTTKRVNLKAVMLHGRCRTST